jgi:mono/diheme cytochrome c family protein
MSRLQGVVAMAAAVMLVTGTRSLVAQEPAAPAPDGKALYEQNCRRCHGATGTPSERMVEMYATLKPLSQMTGVTADSIVTLLVAGGSEGMKSYKDKLTAAELKAVADYTLALSKPQGP